MAQQQKPSAQIFTADGAGGMRAVADHRFDVDWPISFVVQAKHATEWMAHLDAECEARGWQSSGLSQIDADENSGSLSVHTAVGASPPTIEIAWEKVRDESLRVRARTGGSPLLSLDVPRDCFSAVDVRLRNKTTIRAHRRAFLTYDVLEWRGELWLDVDLRLGPPTKHPAYLYGPQIVVVDAMVEGIGFRGVNAQFQRTLAELRIFLTAVLGSHFELDKQREGWTYSRDGTGRVADLSLASLGYVEVEGEASPGFPPIGAAPPIERRAIARPGIGAGGITTRERWVPDDIEQLWRLLRALPAAKRDHFLKAGNAHLVAQSMWPEQRTAYAFNLGQAKSLTFGKILGRFRRQVGYPICSINERVNHDNCLHDAISRL
jgi:hypothetical protein